MPLQPKRVKHRKEQRGSRKGNAKGGAYVDYGQFGIQALDRGWITATQIEAARVAISRHVKRHGKVWIRCFPNKPISKKPLEVRMGKGKGAPDQWVAVIRPGRVLFEIDGVSEELAKSAMARAAAKLPIKTRFVTRHER
jgi:large subunit ribosomal protein L16